MNENKVFINFIIRLRKQEEEAELSDKDTRTRSDSNPHDSYGIILFKKYIII